MPLDRYFRVRDIKSRVCIILKWRLASNKHIILSYLWVLKIYSVCGEFAIFEMNIDQRIGSGLTKFSNTRPIHDHEPPLMVCEWKVVTDSTRITGPHSTNITICYLFHVYYVELHFSRYRLFLRVPGCWACLALITVGSRICSPVMSYKWHIWLDESVISQSMHITSLILGWPDSLFRLARFDRSRNCSGERNKNRLHYIRLYYMFVLTPVYHKGYFRTCPGTQKQHNRVINAVENIPTWKWI